jgi:hypothetical protein
MIVTITVIGNSTKNVVVNLKSEDKVIFYENVRKFYVSVCHYMIHKFPFKDEILKHAEVCSLKSIENASFTSIEFFIDRFPILLCGQVKDKQIDILQTEFCQLQSTVIKEDLINEIRADTQWYLIGEITDEFGHKPFTNISKFMLSILTIPHSNAEYERIFRQVKKIRNEFRSSLSDVNLESLLIAKYTQNGKCFEQKFSDSLLKMAKSASFEKKLLLPVKPKIILYLINLK